MTSLAARFTNREYTELLSRKTSRKVVVPVLTKTRCTAALAHAGLQDAFAADLADSDTRAGDGWLFDDSRTLKTAIGRATTPLEQTLGAAPAAKKRCRRSLVYKMRTSLLLLTCALAGVTASAAPATSKAIVQTEQGLVLQTVDTPVPGAGQVLIKVYAVGVNPVDWKRRARIPGFDAAGVIDSVGPGVTAFKPGTAVLAQANGSYAEYAVANVDETIPKPKRLSFEQAAGVPIAGIAGYRAVEEAKVQPGQRIVIIGAAGGTGEAAVQVAKTRRARIIAVGHSSQRAFLTALGVDEFVAFDKEDVAARVQNVDAAINLVDGQAAAALSYVRRGGHLTSIAGSPGEERAADAGVTIVIIAAGTYHGISNGDALRAVGALAAKGQYTVTVSTTLPLADAAKAQELGRTGQTIGKTVLLVDAAKAKSH